jgi:hypothetical protein
MEKLLKLINEYEESRWETIDDWLTEEEREEWAIIEEKPMWSEYEWHLRHCNAKTVAYEKDTFDAYAISKRYGFIKWLVDWHKIDSFKLNTKRYEEFEEYKLANYKTVSDEYKDKLHMILSISENPISDLISILE